MMQELRTEVVYTGARLIEEERKNGFEVIRFVRASWGAAVLRPYMIWLAGKASRCGCMATWEALHLTVGTLRNLGCGTQMP